METVLHSGSFLDWDDNIITVEFFNRDRTYSGDIITGGGGNSGGSGSGGDDYSTLIIDNNTLLFGSSNILTAEVQITASGSPVLDCTALWVSWALLSQVGDVYTYRIVCLENKAGSTRTADITVGINGVSLDVIQDTITAIQDGANVNSGSGSGTGSSTDDDEIIDPEPNDDL